MFHFVNKLMIFNWNSFCCCNCCSWNHAWCLNRAWTTKKLEVSASFIFLFDSGSSRGRFLGRIFTIAFGFSSICDFGGGKGRFSKSDESSPISGNDCKPRLELCSGKDLAEACWIDDTIYDSSERGGSLIPKWAKFASHIRSRTLTFLTLAIVTKKIFRDVFFI